MNLNTLAWISMAAMAIGWAAPFVPPVKWLGVLFPVGLATFWIVGIIARRRDRSPLHGDGT